MKKSGAFGGWVEREMLRWVRERTGLMRSSFQDWKRAQAESRKKTTRRLALPHSEVFHVDVPPQAAVEEQIPAWVMVVVVHEDLVAIPAPVAATIDVIGSDNPV